MESNEFNTVTEFRKEYDRMRMDILNRHGYKPGDRVRLKKAMTLLMSFDGQNYINSGLHTIIDMKDKVSMYELSSQNVLFKLKALV